MSRRVIIHASPLIHYIRALAFVATICLLTGCWEEIEYRGPIASDSSANAKLTPTTEVAAAPTLPAADEPQTSPPAEEPDTSKLESDSAGATAPAQVSLAPPAEAPSTDLPTSDPPAMPEPAAADAPPAPVSTKRSAWILGSRFTLAALANDRGIAPDEVPKWFDEARTIAHALSVPLADLPKPPPQSPSYSPSREVLGHILNEEKTIGPLLATNYGPDHDAIFRLAMRANLLRVLNTPGSKAVATLSNSIAELGPRTGLPSELWQPLLDTLNDAATTSAAISTAVPQTHQKIEQHLASEHSGQ